MNNHFKRKGFRFLVKRDRYLLAMILPVLVYYIIFHYLPMSGAVIAFKDFKPGGGIYNGEVQIMASKGGLTNAYSLAQIFPKSTVQLDKSLSDDDTTVSVVLGKEYLQNALKSDEIKLLGADKPITAPSDCVPADKAATKKPS